MEAITNIAMKIRGIDIFVGSFSIKKQAFTILSENNTIKTIKLIIMTIYTLKLTMGGNEHPYNHFK